MLADDSLLPAQIFNDADVHAQELSRVFGRAWVYVGHESEISEPGDYVLRYIGEEPFVFVQSDDSKVRLLFDACRHRGTQVCRAEKGNASHFRCPYHGWTYKNTGELVGMPAARATADGLDRKAWGLIEAPRLERFHGLYFACLDDSAPPLSDYLGGMAYYLEMLFELIDDLDVVAEPHRWVIDGNWKLGAENFIGDDYHAVFLHRSMFEIGAIKRPPSENIIGHHISTGNGHGLSIGVGPDPSEGAFWGFPKEVSAAFRPDLLDAEGQSDLARRCRGGGGNVFPNMSFMAFKATGSPQDLDPTAFVNLRLWQPHGPAAFELWSWVLAPKSAPREFREASYRACMSTFSTSGVFEQDDTVPWRTITRTAGGSFARTIGLSFNYQMGSTVGTAERERDWPGPGWASSHVYEETVQKAFYRRWLDFMLEADYPKSWDDPRVTSD
jgi:phenylpropionate dioxygenase-like ring-hydroxylating dioxygenase large terminal subunit